jgi:hypothetical protein
MSIEVDADGNQDVSAGDTVAVYHHGDERGERPT